LEHFLNFCDYIYKNLREIYTVYKIIEEMYIDYKILGQMYILYKNIYFYKIL